MQLFDSHCHFETDDETEIAAQLTRAKSAGVEKLLAVGGSVALSRNAAKAAALAGTMGDAAPSVLCAFGIDRDQLGISDEDRARAASPLDAPDPVAIGEIGLDYHYSPETRDAQIALFAEQLEVARIRNLPVIIHTREAAADTRAILTGIPSRGIIHCFTGGIPEARTYLDLGFYISISGIVTFRSADTVRETARFIPADRLLIETDAPYLAPVPMRGHPNEPSFLQYTCSFLASLRGQTPNAWGQTPNAWGQTPNAWGQTPNAWGQTPNAWGQTPNAWGQTPNAWGQTPEKLARQTFINAEKALIPHVLSILLPYILGVILPHGLGTLLAVIGVALLLPGCSCFHSGDAAEDNVPASEIITVTDIDFTPEETNLLTQATAAAKTGNATTNTVASATNAVRAVRIVVHDLPSPNFDQRRLPVSMIVLHYTAAPLRESLNALRNARGPKRVSAHYVVAPNGTIYRLVDESKRAWHAGVSRWGKIEDVNSASIGIEMVNLGHDRLGRPRPYPAKQIEAVINLCLSIQSRYVIRDVVGHSDVAPNRKIDPGELFPWGMLAKRGVNVHKNAGKKKR